MKQAEIKVVIESKDGDFDINAKIPGGTDPAKLIYGLWCHVRVIAEHLHQDRRKIIFMVSMVDQIIEQNPDKVQNTLTHIVLPKGLNLNGKEVQE